MANLYNPSPEELGRRRFPDNKSFRKTLTGAATSILNQWQQLLASNYPEDFSTNLNILNRVMAREIARLNISMTAINNDKQYTQTRVQYLQQILGERLFLGNHIAPVGYSDESYRQYLTAIKSANLKGSRKSTIEALASEFTGQTVNIQELYLPARDPSSSLGVSAANKMIVQVFIEEALKAGQNINVLKANLDFFINLVRPAHVLYDTELIWKEQTDVNKVHDVIFGDTGGGCVPFYAYTPFKEDEPTYLAMQVLVLPTPITPPEEGIIGVIDSIHHTDFVFYLDDSTRFITEPGVNGTVFYDRNGKRITIDGLEIGQQVLITYQEIPGSFNFWYPFDFPAPFSQFYRDYYRLPLFQETVKKVMDAQGRFPLQVKTTPTTICDRWVQDSLQPLYEDLRGDCQCGKEYKASMAMAISDHKGFPKFSWPQSPELYDAVLSGSDYVQFMEHYPLCDRTGGTAHASDILVMLDGTALNSGIITSFDASSGRINLNDSSTYWKGSVFGGYPSNGDEYTFNYFYLKDGSGLNATTQTIVGISHWQLPGVPIVTGDGSGTLASSVAVSLDGTVVNNAIVAFDPLLGHVTLSPYSSFWESFWPHGEVKRLWWKGDDNPYESIAGVDATWNPFVTQAYAPGKVNDAFDLNPPLNWDDYYPALWWKGEDSTKEEIVGDGVVWDGITPAYDEGAVGRAFSITVN